MEKLTQLQQPSVKRMVSKKSKTVSLASKESDLIELFPLPKYFQIHFQYIHESNNMLKNELSQMTQQLMAMEAKLNQLMQSDNGLLHHCQTCQRRSN